MNIDFFILAGGYGKRALPLSLFKPKPVFPFGDIPLINIIIEQIRKKGINKGWINSHYLAEVLENSVYDKKGIRFVYENILSGSAILNTAFEKSEDYVLSINGDIFLDIPVTGLLEKISSSNSDGVLLVGDDKKNEYAKLDIIEDKLNGINKNKNESGKMFLGVGIFKKKILKYFKDKNFFDSFIKNKLDIRVLNYSGIWLDIGSPLLYFKGVFEYFDYIGINLKNSLSKTVNISEDSNIEYSVLWDNVTIVNSEIRNSIILNDVFLENKNIDSKIVYKKGNDIITEELKIKNKNRK